MTEGIFRGISAVQKEMEIFHGAKADFYMSVRDFTFSAIDAIS